VPELSGESFYLKAYTFVLPLTNTFSVTSPTSQYTLRPVYHFTPTLQTKKCTPSSRKLKSVFSFTTPLVASVLLSC